MLCRDAVSAFVLWGAAPYPYPNKKHKNEVRRGSCYLQRGILGVWNISQIYCNGMPGFIRNNVMKSDCGQLVIYLAAHSIGIGQNP